MAEQLVVRLAKRVRAASRINRVLTRAARPAVQALHRGAGSLERHLPRIGLVEVPLPNGTTLRLLTRDDDDGLASLLWWRGWSAHEPEVATAVWHLAGAGGAVLDIGAHTGVHGLLAALACPFTEVHALEPSPATFARLTQNVASNDLEHRFHCVPAAAGSADGSAQLYVGSLLLGTTNGLDRDFAGRHGLKPSVEVAVRRLDDYVATAVDRPVTLVKMDVEGFEFDALQGFARTLEA